MRKILSILVTSMVLFACKGNESNQATGDQALAASADITNAEKVYNLDVASSKIEWKGSKLLGSDYHDGVITPQSGKLGFSDNQPIAGEIVIDMTTISNTDLAESPEDQAKLEGHLKSDDFFGVEQFPQAKFVITTVAAQGNNSYTVKGNLTIRDKTEAIEFPAEISQSDSGISAVAKLTFDRSKFNVKFRSTSFAEFVDIAKDKVIDDKIELKLSLKLS